MPLSFSIEPRTLHFKFPAGTSRGVYTERRIWLLHVRDADDPTFCGTGECAPLFDLSPDYTEDYAQHLAAVCRAVEQCGQLPADLLRTMPSVRFGIETALQSAQANSKGMTSLSDTPFGRGEAGIPTNGLVWMGDRSTMFQRLDAKLAQGCRCIKIKIGAIGLADELDLIAAVRSRGSERLQLRVDANGAFRPDEAMGVLESLARYGVHSIEQPIKAGQWDAMARLCRESPVPIALDEELIGLYSVSAKAAMLDRVRPAYLVLKPTLHGGFSGCEEWIRLAEERHIGWWVTSALESNVGLAAIAHWTSRLLHQRCAFGKGQGEAENHTAAYPQAMYQGLGTGQLFTDNIPMPSLQMRGDELWYAP